MISVAFVALCRFSCFCVTGVFVNDEKIIRVRSDSHRNSFIKDFSFTFRSLNSSEIIRLFPETAKLWSERSEA